MDRFLRRRSLALVALVTVEAFAALRLSAATHTHRGYIFDAVGRQRIAAAFFAYASEKPVDAKGNCLRFEGNPLDDGTSDAKTGVFTVTLVNGPRRYTMSYCRDGYVPRALTGNDNDSDKVPVKGPGIRLCPTNGKLTIALANLHRDVRGEVMAIASLDVDAFREAAQRLPPPERALIRSLTAIQLAQLPSHEASVEDIEQYLRETFAALDEDLKYLRSVNADQFEKALDNTKDLQAYPSEKKLFGDR